MWSKLAVCFLAVGVLAACDRGADPLDDVDQGMAGVPGSAEEAANGNNDQGVADAPGQENDMQTIRIAYSHNDVSHEGVAVFEAGGSARPLLLMVPNWLGVTDAAVEKAEQVARMGYVVFVADMYGVGRQPADFEQAAAAVGALYGDRAELRARAQRALDVATEQATAWPVSEGLPGMIGFCFGGATALEVARSGTSLLGAVSFHGNLAFEASAPAPDFNTRLLVLHGDADPYVPPDEVNRFLEEVRAHDVDWQLVRYGGAVHSFTDPYANMPGEAMYHERTANRAFAAMRAFFDEAAANTD